MKYLIAIAFAFVSSFAFPQQRQVIINDNHGSIPISINNYNLKGKDAILNVAKYINTAKAISVLAGSGMHASGFITMAQLKSSYGVHPFNQKNGASPIELVGGEGILSLRLVKGKLKINSQILGFDQKYIATIVDNKLIASRPDYHLYVSDRYFELFDDYYIPVLQIELIKNLNAIYIGGAFVHESGYTIISKEHGLFNRNLGEPIIPMEQHKKDSLFYEYLQAARKMLTPIHE